MTRQQTNRIMLAATVLYGLVIAVVAVTAGDATGVVAFVGALIVGGGWTLTSIFVRNPGKTGLTGVKDAWRSPPAAYGSRQDRR